MKLEFLELNLEDKVSFDGGCIDKNQMFQEGQEEGLVGVSRQVEGQETEQAIGTTEESGRESSSRPKRIIRMPARFND